VLVEVQTARKPEVDSGLADGRLNSNGQISQISLEGLGGEEGAEVFREGFEVFLP
jgi:hypothetical protein